MSIGTYISIITLNENGSNVPTKRHRLAECIQKLYLYLYLYLYKFHKKPTSDLKTHIDWKWEDGKIYSMQMEIKRKWDAWSF